MVLVKDYPLFVLLFHLKGVVQSDSGHNNRYGVHHSNSPLYCRDIRYN